MKLFTPIYRRLLPYVESRRTEKYLYGFAFAESIFFPIPTDVLLAPMCAVQPSRALRFGILTTVFSVIGGAVGYLLGFFLFEAIESWLIAYDLIDQYRVAEGEFQKWGAWIIFVAAFSPIPYKVFTITAGAFHQAFLPFMLASLLGRGVRYIAVALILKYLGPLLLPKVEKWIEQLGWAFVVATVVVLVFYYFDAV